MLPRVNDRWLWLGLGIVSFFALRSVARALRKAVKRDRVREQPERPRAVTQETEDSISVESLAVLANCPNHDIRNVAIKIFSTRVARDNSTLALLQADLRNSDPAVHERATNAHNLLERNLGRCPFLRPRMPLHPPAAYFICPMCVPSPYYYTPLDGSDAIGRNGDDGGEEDDDDDDYEWQTANTSRPGSPAPLALPRLARLRPHPEGAEELARRRRRREAMVLHEGNSPIVQGDIIQRV